MVDSVFYAARQTLVAPSMVFAKIKEGQLKREVTIMFGAAMAITLAKALARVGAGYAQASDFFPSEFLNELLSLLRNPLVTWVYSYLVYFLFLWGCTAHDFLDTIDAVFDLTCRSPQTAIGAPTPILCVAV